MSAPTFTPEFGQVAFGAAYGDHDAGDLGEACLSAVLAEIDRVYWNLNQQQWLRGSDPGIAGITFRPYCWGECDCGRDEREAAWSAAHGHTAVCYQADYRKLREADDARRASGAKTSWAKRDAAHDRAAKALCEQHGIPWNGGHGSAVHCDCGYDMAWQEWVERNPHAPTCSPTLPNLVYGDVEIRWYKHPGRGVSVQRAVTADEWAAWLTGALATVRAADVKVGV